METPKQSRADRYESFYREVDSPLMQKIRRETFGEDIGLHSWGNAQEVRANLPAQHDIAAFVHAVDLEHALCYIDSTRCNLHDGLPLARVLDMTNFQSGTSRCRRAKAGVHTIALLTDAYLSALRASCGAAKRERWAPSSGSSV
jgi:hypothetical protein